MAVIPLTQGKQALVDDEDLKLVSDRTWFYGNGYAQNSTYKGGGRKNPKVETVQMHRLILGIPDGFVDHINHDTLDNRKSNLRVTDRSGNARNKSTPKNNTTGYKGVNHHGERFRAQIYINKKNKHLGLFDTAIEAAKAYNKAAQEYFGDFAHINKLETN